MPRYRYRIYRGEDLLAPDVRAPGPEKAIENYAGRHGLDPASLRAEQKGDAPVSRGAKYREETRQRHDHQAELVIEDGRWVARRGRGGFRGHLPNPPKPEEERAVPRSYKLHRPALAAIARLREAWGIPSDAGVIERAVLDATTRLV